MFSPFDPMKFTLTAFETSLAAAATINARLPILFTAALTGCPHAARESRRMFTEKAEAAVDGALAASSAAFELWFRSARAMSLPDPTAWLTVAEAAFAPAARTCKSNSRRLTRKPRHR